MQAFGQLSVLLAAAAVSGPIAGQPAPSDTIDVLGRKPKEVRQQAQEFVRKLGVAERPVARWVEPICPAILGVPLKVGVRVAAKIRDVARDARVSVAKEPCRPNIFVTFTGDGAALVREIAAKAPARLIEVAAEDRPALLNGNAPIRWWHATEARTADRMGTTGNEAPPSARLEAPGGVPLAGEVHFQYRSSMVSTQMMRVLRGASIVIDVNRATGTPLESVAAFAALVALAEVQPNPDAPPNSILNLFAKDGPRDLTQLDLDFLRTLYRLPLDRTALAQRSLLVRGLLNTSAKED